MNEHSTVFCPHSSGRVIKCDGKIDVMKCFICGDEWEEECNFEEDMS